jgi:hypothetical protein
LSWMLPESDMKHALIQRIARPLRFASG